MYSICEGVKVKNKDPKDPENELEELDDELYWREEMMGERPILNPIGYTYHYDGL